ncbi:hypothetical protein [Kineococcus gypseus]|uniref:hypothetical protein n=1 Tax=Kineococcus gypseus TaxID=1637102 RepID=UPI003D7DC159
MDRLGTGTAVGARTGTARGAARGAGPVAAAACVTLLGGAWAWALAATSTWAVHAGEARALGPGHTPDLPGEGEIALVSHDVRLAALAALWCASALLLAPPRAARAARATRRRVPASAPVRVRLAAWLGAGAALVAANALLGPAVDGRSPAPAAALVLLATAAGTALGAAVGAAAGAARGRAGRAGAGAPAAAAADGERWWWLAAAGALAAATACVAVLQGLSTPRYVPWAPGELHTANALVTLVLLAVSAACALGCAGTTADPLPRPARAALVLVPSAAAALLLLDPAELLLRAREQPEVTGPALVAALAPFALVAGPGRRAPSRRRTWTTALVLTALAGLAAVALPVLAPAVLAGGFLGLALTAPAGAYVGYDGVPVTGAGGPWALGALVVLTVLTGPGGDETPTARPAPS